MTVRAPYPRPPIVEAIVEFHLAGTWARDALRDSVGDQLAGLTPRPHDSGDPGGRVLFHSADNARAVGFATSLLSVHVQKPYPGWQSFREQIIGVVMKLPLPIRESGLRALAVRYIDRIEFKEPDVVFNDYFTVMPRRPEQMPEQLLGFSFSTQAFDPKDQTISLLTMSSAIGPAVSYDLSMLRAWPSGFDFKTEDWLIVSDDLHARQKEMFENSITDKMRELFQ